MLLGCNSLNRFKLESRIELSLHRMDSKKHILVTGGAGFIGSHTVVELIEAGYEPVIFDNFSNSKPRMIEQIEKIVQRPVTYFEGDVCSKQQLENAFERYRFEGVIHFAAYKAVGESVEHPLKYYSNNLSGLLVLLDVMREFDVRKFVFSSSCTVYGIPENDICVTEETPLGVPNSPYGWTKWMDEQIIQDVAKSNRFHAVLLRYFNPIGAHVSGFIGELPQGVPNNILPYMTQTAAGIREKLTVFGNDYNTPDGTCVRDYIHVVDLAQAHVKALSIAENQAVQILNLGTGTGTSVLELIHAFEAALGKPMPWEFGPRRSGDVEAIYASVAKAKQVLGWEAQRSVKEAIRDAWRWENYRLENEIN